MPESTTVAILARPGSDREVIAWDVWRKRWAVSCHEPARDGRANDALLAVLADALGVPASRLRWTAGTRSRLKTLCVDGLPAAEIDRRLRAASGSPPRGPT